MSDYLHPKSEFQEPGYYTIRVKGHLGPQWSDWFEGLTISSLENGETIISGLVVDQAALYGLLKKVRDLGMMLISINRSESGPAIK